MRNNQLLKTITESGTKGSNKSQFLSDDPFLNYIYRKTEKMSLALYLTTDHIKDDEPLKTKIRHKSVEMVDMVLSYKDLNFQKDDQKARGFVSNYLAIMSYIETATLVGLMKETNYFILHKELNDILVGFTEQISGNSMVAGELKDKILNINNNAMSVNNKRVSKRQNLLKDTLNNDEGFVKDKKIYKNDEYELNNEGQNSKRTRSLESNMFSKQSFKKLRREKILSMFSVGSGHSVKDISIALPDISEKTVQRELNSLVEKNVLYKEGDRRWTKYFLRS